jgi:2-methylisocitrate lyase-like PEP mutase family enzyme
MTTRLKTLFQQPELFVLAGGINPIGAKMAEALGYDAFYMSGGNTSAHQLGWPDSGTSMRDMVDNARKIVLTVDIPVFADADTGYGDAISTHYTVMAAFWTSRVCAPWRRCIFQTEAARRCPGLSLVLARMPASD